MSNLTKNQKQGGITLETYSLVASDILVALARWMQFGNSFAACGVVHAHGTDIFGGNNGDDPAQRVLHFIAQYAPAS